MRKYLIIYFLISSTCVQSQVIDSAFIKCNINYYNCLIDLFRHYPDDSIARMTGEKVAEKNWITCSSKSIVPNIISTDIKGDSINIFNLDNKVIVLNFWYLGCPPCMKEIPSLNKLSEEFKNKDVEFFSITFDKKERIPKNLTLNFKIITDAKYICDLYGVSSYPETFIIAKSKKVVKIFFGADLYDNSSLFIKLKNEIDKELIK